MHRERERGKTSTHTHGQWAAVKGGVMEGVCTKLEEKGRKHECESVWERK